MLSAVTDLVPYAELSKDECCKIVKQTVGKDYLCCAKPVKDGSIYCPQHAQDAFRQGL